MFHKPALAVCAVILAVGIWSNASGEGPVTCPTRPVGDNSNACASTAFVKASPSGSGGGGGSVNQVANGDGTLTISPTTGNVVASLNPAHANTWTGVQSFTPNGMVINGSTSGNLTFRSASVAGSSVVQFPAGSTLFPATGGAGQFVKQAAPGAALTVSAPIISEIGGQGTGVAAALGTNVGTAGSVVVNGGALGTPSSGTLTNATGLPISGITGLGTGVATALAVTASSPGGFSVFKAQGTIAMGTTAILSATCGSAKSASAVGINSTDIVNAGFNGDPTATTGFIPLTTGLLYLIPYPTTDNVNFKYCNSTTATITPAAVTFNWIVVR